MAAANAMACDLCAIYNASAARGETGVGWHFSLAQQVTDSGTLMEGGESVSDPFAQYRLSSITSLLIGYKFNPRIGLSINIPYIHRSFRRIEGFSIDEGTESGLGDVSLLGRYVVYAKPEHSYSLFLSVFAGLEFPTGDPDRLREEADEVEIPGAPESGVHGDDLALGSGSFDPLVGASANARWQRIALSVDAQYFIRTRGDFGYRFGNELSVSVAPGFYALFTENYSLGVYANFLYETKGRDRIAGEKRNEGISSAWYGGPGLILTWGEHLGLTANVDIPLGITTRSTQVVPDYRVRGGVTWNF